jgi:xanthine dehydrogenase accessory factor
VSEASLSVAEAVARALAAEASGVPVALVVAVRAPQAGAVGRRLVVTPESLAGTLGDAALDARAARLAREALVAGERAVREIDWAGGTWELYLEAQHPAPALIIVGAGHIGRALSRLAATLGFSVTVLDDRREFANRELFPEARDVRVIDFQDPFAGLTVGSETYVVLVTRGHKYDYDCILRLLRMNDRPAYLGMIGSRRRVRAAFEALRRDGVDPARLAAVRAPVGLDIGAETPEEIALAIAAELVATRRGGSGAPLSERERVLDHLRNDEAERS